MNNRKSLIQTVSLAALAMTVAGTDIAVAQINELIVTSRKRAERFIDVPVVSSVLDAQQLQTFQTNNFFNTAERIPGMIVGDNVGNVGANVTLRGIGSTAFNPATDGAVSVNIDGIQFSHGDVLRSGFFDVQQVEVLKGPQALFFGKNSPGGIISLRTADPTDEAEMFGSIGYEFEADEFLGQAVVSGPVNDWLGVRVALSYSDQEGYFDNIAQPTPGLGGAGPAEDRLSSAENFFSRLTFLAEPNERFSARLKFTYDDRNVDGDGGTAQLVGCDVAFDPIENCVLDDKVAISDLDPALFVNPLTMDPVLNNGIPFQDTYRAFGSLELNYDLTEELTLTSITGLSEFNHEFAINGTFQPGTVDQTTPFVGLPGSSTIHAVNEATQKFFTQEVRLTSNFESSPINFMIGAFYEDGSFENSRDVRVPLFGVYNDDGNDIDIETISAFGQVIYDVTDTLEIAAGVRYTDEERSLSSFDNGLFLTMVGPVFGPGNVTNAVTENNADNWSPEATITWRPNENLTLFAAYKEGFKSGSFNVDQATPLDRSYDEETAEGFEIGAKTLFLDGALNINAAAYSYKYDDLQVSRTVNAPGGTGTLLQVVNAASADVQGFEIDASYSPPQIEGLTIYGGVNYNKGEFDDFAGAVCYGGQTVSLGCNQDFSAFANAVGPGVFLGGFTSQDLSGRQLPRSPEWSANFGFDLDRPLGNTGLNFGLSSTTSYTDDMVLDSSYNPRTFQDSYFKTSASLRLYPENESWEIAFIGNNLGDEITASTCFSGPFDQAGGIVPNPSGLPINPIIAGSTDNAACFAEPGRELWLRLTVRPTNWN